jgi:hypothetical protein
MLSTAPSRTALAPAGWFAKSSIGLKNRLLASVKITEGPRYNIADVGIDPRTLFGLYTDLLTNPTVQRLYIMKTGNDATGDGTLAKPYLTVSTAINVANTRGVRTIFVVKEGVYTRFEGFSQINLTVEHAFLADGRPTITTSDVITWAADATYTNTSSAAIGSVDRIVDLLARNRFGDYAEPAFVSTAAICNKTPNSWAFEGGKAYINRIDGALASATNTRLYRPNVYNGIVLSPVNSFFGGLAEGDGFDFEGGLGGGCMYFPSSMPAVPKVFVVDNCSAKYAGGSTGVGNGFAVDSIHGVAAFFRCHASANSNDAFNGHHTATNTGAAAAKTHMFTINCTGYDNGRFNKTSCNGWTTHEDVVGADFGGVYDNNHGGTLRSIGASMSWFVGTIVRNDLGDGMLGGTGATLIRPSAVMADESAVYYLDGVQIDMPAGTIELRTSGSGAILTRNMPTIRSAIGNVKAY